MKVIGKAFDDAWSEISGHFSRNGLQAQSVRLKLARAVLAVARDDSRDSDDLKNAAFQIMATTVFRFVAVVVAAFVDDNSIGLERQKALGVTSPRDPLLHNAPSSR